MRAFTNFLRLEKAALHYPFSPGNSQRDAAEYYAMREYARGNLNYADWVLFFFFFSMEECEALCSRLGIMVNGQLQCLGKFKFN